MSVRKLELNDLCNIIISIVSSSIISVIIIIIILCGKSLGRGPGRAVTTLGSILRFEVITEEVRSEKGCAFSLVPGKHVQPAGSMKRILQVGYPMGSALGSQGACLPDETSVGWISD